MNNKIISIKEYKRKKASLINETEFIYSNTGKLVKSVSDRVVTLFDEKENIKEQIYVKEDLKTKYFYNEDNKLIKTIDVMVDMDGNEEIIIDSEVIYIHSDNYKKLTKVNPDKSTEYFEYDDRGNMILYGRYILGKETRKCYYDDDNNCIKEELYLDNEDKPFITKEFLIIKGINSVLIKSIDSTKYIKYDKNKKEKYYEDDYCIRESEYDISGKKVKETHILKNFFNKLIEID